jgi:ribosomal protein S18 acetylase RimI-like enzyme
MVVIVIDGESGVRRATHGDIDVLVEVHQQARDTYYRGVVPDEELDDPAEHAILREAYTRSLAAPDRVVLCVDRETTVAGFASIGPPFKDEPGDPTGVGQLIGLYVRPLFWSSGVGGLLHAQCVALWRANGLHTARLEVWAGNTRAAAFYERRGWRPDGYERPGLADLAYRRLTLSL